MVCRYQHINISIRNRYIHKFATPIGKMYSLLLRMDRLLQSNRQTETVPRLRRKINEYEQTIKEIEDRIQEFEHNIEECQRALRTAEYSGDKSRIIGEIELLKREHTELPKTLAEIKNELRICSTRLSQLNSTRRRFKTTADTSPASAPNGLQRVNASTVTPSGAGGDGRHAP